MTTSEFVDRLQQALGTAYRIEHELPLSGLGRVFLATDAATGRHVTVQALPPDIAARLDANRFRAAVDRVARLRHPGIAPLIAAGARDDLVWCVWPHPRGESLRYRLVRDGGLVGTEAGQVLHDVAGALAYGHAQGIAHGDLRPDNIYLENGHAVVAEYGIRTALTAALEGEAGGPDARADVHALAVVGQQMLGGRASGPVSAVLGRALSIDPAEQYPSAEALRAALGLQPGRGGRFGARAVAVGIVLLLLAGLVWRVVRQGAALDPNRLAVAPFEILDPAHAVWREGLMTVLSGNLDGAGPLHTVSPTVVVRQWQGRADADGAAQLGRRTGAGLALVGRVIRTGGDTMRLVATLLDVDTDAGIAEITLSDPAARLDRLADSLTVRVLRELSRSRPIGAARRASLGATSLPALKAFLEGEQHYRRTQWDSAIAAYQQAIELDSAFALALFRAGVVLGWQSNSADSLSVAYLLRAGRHNRGLPARDSLLVVAESLSSALVNDADPRYWAWYRRLYSTTEALVRRYPRDPEAWYEFGDVRYHYPQFATLQQMRDAFDRSIRLDSAFAPSYLHPIVLALELGDPQGARRYIDRYLRLRPRDIHADGVRLTRRLLEPRARRDPDVQAVLDTAGTEQLAATLQFFGGWADSAETEARLLRAQQRRWRALGEGARADALNGALGRSLAYAGRLTEAYAVAGLRTGTISAALVWMGGVPDESTATAMRASLGAPVYPGGLAVIAAPWFARVRDTLSLRELARRADSLARAGRGPMERAQGEYLAAGARALGALARGDTATAVRGLLALADTACVRCRLFRVTLAELLDAKEMDAEASALLAEDSPGFSYPTDGFWALYRARLAERQGDGLSAVAAWRFVRDVWANADPSLQPYVREARDALARWRERD